MEESPIRKVRHYKTVDELLEVNNKFKEEALKDYKSRLQYLKDGYDSIKNDPNIDKEKLEKLNKSISKLENYINFYENRSW